MKRITVVFFALIVSTVGAAATERHLAFERDNAIYVANLDGSGEKKIASGTFPASFLQRMRPGLSSDEHALAGDRRPRETGQLSGQADGVAKTVRIQVVVDPPRGPARSLVARFHGHFAP